MVSSHTHADLWLYLGVLEVALKNEGSFCGRSTIDGLTCPALAETRNAVHLLRILSGVCCLCSYDLPFLIESFVDSMLPGRTAVPGASCLLAIVGCRMMAWVAVLPLGLCGHSTAWLCQRFDSFRFWS